MLPAENDRWLRRNSFRNCEAGAANRLTPSAPHPSRNMRLARRRRRSASPGCPLGGDLSRLRCEAPALGQPAGAEQHQRQRQQRRQEEDAPGSQPQVGQRQQPHHHARPQPRGQRQHRHGVSPRPGGNLLGGDHHQQYQHRRGEAARDGLAGAVGPHAGRSRGGCRHQAADHGGEEQHGSPPPAVRQRHQRQRQQHAHPHRREGVALGGESGVELVEGEGDGLAQQRAQVAGHHPQQAQHPQDLAGAGIQPLGGCPEGLRAVAAGPAQLAVGQWCEEPSPHRHREPVGDVLADQALGVAAFEDVHGAPVVGEGPADRPKSRLGCRSPRWQRVLGRRGIRLFDHDIGTRPEQALQFVRAARFGAGHTGQTRPYRQDPGMSRAYLRG